MESCTSSNFVYFAYCTLCGHQCVGLKYTRNHDLVIINSALKRKDVLEE